MRVEMGDVDAPAKRLRNLCATFCFGIGRVRFGPDFAEKIRPCREAILRS